ncbi:endonuclease [Sulfitobacter albidus]|uniref:Endonuclease n=1 Tax=Sulfitobacter albidus TaxID=2829501 RepID=A0A975PLC2_9RHOB|nr:endonuclease [Sulfitobacter albidus]QUJ75050.1 endonuclease [Sulfitobacter albidus]
MAQQNNTECQLICWGIAAVVGFLAMIMLYWMAAFGALQAIFTGGLIGFVLGLVLGLFVCRGQTAKADLSDEASKPANRYAAEAEKKKTPAAEVTRAGSAATVAGSGDADGTSDVDMTQPLGTMAAVSGTAATAAAPAASASTIVKPSKELPGQQELAARKGEWKYENDSVAAPAEPIPGGAPVTADAAAPAAPTPQAAPSPAEGPGSAPELMDAPRSEGADDLKLISGVGPKLEGTLNEMGIWHFDQVAKWGKKEIAWVDSRLRFKGRIERDDWMSQAKVLAKGGETEFSRKKKKS